MAVFRMTVLAFAAAQPTNWGNCTHPWPQAMDVWTAFTTASRASSFAFVADEQRILIEVTPEKENRLEVTLICGSLTDVFVRGAVEEVIAELPDVCGKDLVVAGDVLASLPVLAAERQRYLCAIPGPRIHDVVVLEAEIRVVFDQQLQLVRSGAAARLMTNFSEVVLDACDCDAVRIENDTLILRHGLRPGGVYDLSVEPVFEEFVGETVPQ